MLEQMGEISHTCFYSSESVSIPNVKSKGPLKYPDEMPCVFRYSKLNLNPTLKCIQSGIPLRALDIMGAKGVLLSNYQPELAEYFENEKDLILYESIEDAVARHENLRGEIAANGYKKVKESFSYPERINTMFRIAQIDAL